MNNTKKKDANDLIEESVNFANQIKSSAQKSALNTFSALIAEDIKQDITESDEPFPSKPDQPAGYDAEGSQKRIDGSGDAVEDEGDGPDIIEGDEPDEGGATMGKEDDPVTADNANDTIAEMDDLNLDLPDEEEGGVEDEKDMNMESTELSVEGEEEKEEKEEKEKKDAMVKENKSLRKVLATLKTENAKLKKGINSLRKALHETALINTKMDYVNKVNTQFPTLSVNTKKKVFEHIDKAKSVSQAKNIFETVTNVIKENLKNVKKGPSQRAQKIVESAEKAKKDTINNSLNENYNYMTRMAGIDNE